MVYLIPAVVVYLKNAILFIKIYYYKKAINTAKNMELKQIYFAKIYVTGI
jgi:hypothetical protein